MGVVLPEPKRDKIKKIYTYEETTAEGRTIKYQGKDSTVYSGTSKNKPNKEPKLPDNDFQSSNYALMIYDQKKNAFRLVPINRHIQFERQMSVQQVVPKVTTAPTIQGGIPARRPNTGPRKKAKDILKNFKNLIKQQKGHFTSSGTATETAKRGRKKKFEDDEKPAAKKAGNASDSALEYSDGNDEYNKAVEDNHINDDSAAENVEEVQDILMDLPSEEEEEPSVESKASRVTQPKPQVKKPVEEVKPVEKINYDDADYESDKLFAYDSNEEEDDSESNVSSSLVGQKRRRPSDDEEDPSDSAHQSSRQRLN